MLTIKILYIYKSMRKKSKLLGDMPESWGWWNPVCDE